MSYFELDDVKRLHQPYMDNIQRLPVWKPGKQNSPFLNWCRGTYAAACGMLLFEPLYHYKNNMTVLS